MSILSRFITLMKANINSRIDTSEQPEKAIQKTLREVTLDLRTVQSEVNALEADVKRSRRAVDECEAEIRKLERYRERVADRDPGKARMFFNEQESLEAKKLELVTNYNRLAIEAKELRLLEEKLSLDIRQLETRHHAIREKAALLNQQEKIILGESSNTSGFNSYEEELNFKIDEANALANLRNQVNTIDSIDEEIAKLDLNNNQDRN